MTRTPGATFVPPGRRSSDVGTSNAVHSHTVMMMIALDIANTFRIAKITTRRSKTQPPSIGWRFCRSPRTSLQMSLPSLVGTATTGPGLSPQRGPCPYGALLARTVLKTGLVDMRGPRDRIRCVGRSLHGPAVVRRELYSGRSERASRGLSPCWIETFRFTITDHGPKWPQGLLMA